MGSVALWVDGPDARGKNETVGAANPVVKRVLEAGHRTSKSDETQRRYHVGAYVGIASVLVKRGAGSLPLASSRLTQGYL